MRDIEEAETQRTRARSIGAVVAVPLGLTLVLVGACAIALGRSAMSGWGWLWSIGSVALGLGLVRWVSISPRMIVLRRMSALGLGLLALARVALFGGSEGASIVVLDARGAIVREARWIDRLFEERDAAVVGGRALVLTGALDAEELPTLPALLEDAYVGAERDAPRLGTPIPATLLGMQGRDGFDAIVVPARARRSGVGVVFLHGYAGNVALPCLELARTARDEGADVICPSTSFEGAWWRGDGEAIVRASIAHLRARGARRIVLAGLSNGGIGASRLAPRLGPEIDALVLLSGVSSRAPSPGVPTLVIQGADDTMVRTRAVRAWARGRSRVRYVELPGTHFVLLEQRARIAALLRAALRAAPPNRDGPA